MKIIADKAPKSRFPFLSECEHCKSILEFEDKTDLKQIQIEDYDPREQETIKYKVEGFHCPCCNKDSRVKPIPKI
jgi:hypothetical protein